MVQAGKIYVHFESRHIMILEVTEVLTLTNVVKGNASIYQNTHKKRRLDRVKRIKTWYNDSFDLQVIEGMFKPWKGIL